MELISALDPALGTVVWLRISELKLPGAGEGARDEPRGPYDVTEADSVLVPLVLPPGYCETSRSKLVLDWAVI